MVSAKQTPPSLCFLNFVILSTHLLPRIYGGGNPKNKTEEPALAKLPNITCLRTQTDYIRF